MNLRDSMNHEDSVYLFQNLSFLIYCGSIENADDKRPQREAKFCLLYEYISSFYHDATTTTDTTELSEQ